MEKKQTAVEWLVEQIKSDQNQKALSASEWMQVIEQAKQIEKEQIIDTWKHGNLPTFLGRALTAEQYYNETFKSE